MTKLAFVLLSCALVLATASARGAGRRIALLHGDPELQRALALALAAWDVETVPLDLQLNEEPDSAARVQAAELAARLRLEGVVWVSSTPEGSRLSVFDSHTGELTVRNLEEVPPFASTTAASLALSVKTALRPSVEQALEPASVAPARRALLPQTRRPARADRAFAPPSPRASLRAMFDVAWLARDKVAPHVGLGTTLWLGSRRRWGTTLQLSLGTGVDVNAPELVARYRDFSIGLGGQWRWLDAGSVSSSFVLGGALRAASLDGTWSEDRSIAVTRYNPAGVAAFQLELRVAGPWLVGLELSACLLARYQRFLVADRPVFAPYRLTPSAGASLGAALF